MILAFDLDDCLCERPKGKEHLGVDKYRYCTPIEQMVKIVNECYVNGYYIKIYTARGMTTYSSDVTKIYENLYSLTKNHLDEWGINYHELIMGKEHYDLLIDDKVVNSKKIKNIKDITINL
jgi:hypothetical protein